MRQQISTNIIVVQHAPTNIIFVGGTISQKLEEHCVFFFIVHGFFYHFGDDKKPEGGRLTSFTRRC
jgi:hypothetical protein